MHRNSMYVWGNFRVDVPESWLCEETEISINTLTTLISWTFDCKRTVQIGENLRKFVDPAETHFSNTGILISMTGKGSCGLQ